MVSLSRALLLLLLLATPVITLTPFGPYKFILEKIERCPNSGSDESTFPTKLFKISNTKAVLNESFKISPPIDKNSKMYLEVQEWGNQGYRPRSYQFTYKTCEEIWKGTLEFLKPYFDNAGVNIEKCPIPEGVYQLNNFEPTLQSSKVPFMGYNKYRVLINMFYNNRKIGCIMFYIEAVPKIR